MYPGLISVVLLLILHQCEKTSAFANIKSTYYFPPEGEKGTFDFAAQRCKDLASSLVRVETSMELHEITQYIEIRFNHSRDDDPFWTFALRLNDIDYSEHTYWSWNSKHPWERVPYTCIRWCHGFPKMEEEDDALMKVAISKDEYSWCAKNVIVSHNYYYVCEKRVLVK